MARRKQIGNVEHGEATNNVAGGLCYITVTDSTDKFRNQLLPFHGDPRVFLGKQVEFTLTAERFVRDVKVIDP